MFNLFNRPGIKRLILLATAVVTQAQANDSEPTTLPQLSDSQFNQCLVQFRSQAKTVGVSQPIIDQAFAQISFDPKVIEYDRRQPEFSESFASYFNKRVNQWRVDKGRKMLQEHQKLLLNLQQRFGIPPQYLVSFWGLETNFGSYKGKMPIIRSLATLACDQRRSNFFTTELMTALKLIEKQQLDPQSMVGSWAGAMGHTQFMPSAYMQYAIDGDGDNRVDLFNSIPDALTSAANFLTHLGWKKGYRWGREVSLTSGFSYHHSGLDNIQPLHYWHQLGVTKANGQPLGQADINAAIVVPAGHTGPAFMVYDNFAVIMRWNRSQFYAIAVGHLADRLSGLSPLKHPPQKTPNLTLDQLLTLQQKLTALGYDVGKPDGVMGPATAKGIRAYQLSQKMIADGFPGHDLFNKLGIEI